MLIKNALLFSRFPFIFLGFFLQALSKTLLAYAHPTRITYRTPAVEGAGIAQSV